MAKDYYNILGVPRTADDTAIKKAYRKLAKKYHPDVNTEPEAGQRFAEVQEAYEVLSDKGKRRRYDQYGHAGVHGGATGAGGEGPFGGGWRASNTGPGGFSFRTASVDPSEFEDLFGQFFGGRGRQAGGAGGFAGFGGGAGTSTRRPRKGRDIEHTLTVPFVTAARGGTTSIRLGGGGADQTLDVKVPAGTADGAKLRLRGKGQPTPAGGEAGDLILTIRVADHPYFRRDGLDLEVDVPISIDEAVFGATVDVPTLNGRATLKVPPGSGGGRKLRLRGAGIRNSRGQQGDLYAVLRIDVPETLTDEQRQGFERLRGELPDPRRNVDWA